MVEASCDSRSLWFGDNRGFAPSKLEFGRDSSLVTKFTRTKTIGSDKRVLFEPLVIGKELFVRSEWLATGLELSQNSAS